MNMATGLTSNSRSPARTTLAGRSRLAVLCAAAALLAVASGPATAAEPRLPPGLSPVGRVGVALIGPGIDYRRPDIYRHLARDGEGDLISWDFTDGDNRPFDDTGIGTLSALSIAMQAPRALITIVRENLSDPHSFGHAMQFAANSPARVVIWHGAAPARRDWPIFVQAVRRFQDRLFIIAAGDEGRDLDNNDAYTGIRRAPNLLVVAGKGRSQRPNGGKSTVDVTVVQSPPDELGDSWQAALAITTLAARILDRDQTLSPSAVKTLITHPAPKGIAAAQGRINQVDAYRLFQRPKK